MENLYTTDNILVYVGGDENQLKEMIDLFLNTIPEEFESLENNIENKNWDKAYEISHRIKPSMEILQIKNATEEFFDLNIKLHKKSQLSEIPDLFKMININVNSAIEQIKKDFKL